MWSTDGTGELLAGWRVELPGGAHPAIRAAAQILASAGAGVTGMPAGDPGELRLSPPARTTVGVRVSNLARAGAALEQLVHGPAILAAYAGLRVAGAAAAAARCGRDLSLDGVSVSEELLQPIRLRGRSRPELIRCSDGWAVVRWREPSERELLHALVGPERDCSCDELVAQGRLARLLIAPVRPPRRGGGVCSATGGLAGGRPPGRPRIRVVDWSVLWAGPWAAGQLRRAGALVCRVEHPRRPDGLLGWAQGRRCWLALNQGKRLAPLDARRPCDRDRLARELAGADLLVTSMTPRALIGLGFGDAWRRQHAPGLLHLELVAFEEPWADAPGLGEHAAAQAGLLWREDQAPAPPHPWADPLLGASAFALAQIWLASGTRPPGRVRLSLEAAAGLPFALQSEETVPLRG